MLTRALSSACLTAALLALFFLAAPAAAQDPLHQRIDQAIAAAVPDFAKKASPPAPDAEFLRRVYLDLTGTIPTADEARAFLAEQSPGKRAALIDRLLASPEHARYLAQVLDVMLMERRPAKHVGRPEWLEFLRQSVAANKPYDQLVREILAGDGSEADKRVQARFFLDREAEPHLLTRDLSRLFLGMNLQCAQCHDHPRITEYQQDHYYGLFAYVSRTSLFTDTKTRKAMLAEKADGEVSFQSVFDPAKVQKSTGPRLPGGAVVKEPAPVKGKEYIVAPAKDVRAVPTFSRRALLGPALARADNVPFKRNIANRLWALMMGRGLVHPLDLDHPDNPPSHPALLTLLADELAGRQFDLRWYLRELTLSQTYQRSSEPPPGVEEVEPTHYTTALLRPLSPEQFAFAVVQATGLADSFRLTLGKGLAEDKLHAQTAPAAAPLVNAFANQPGTAASFDATVDQALFLANGPTLRSWLTPRAGNLTDRLAKAPSGEALADELYLGILTRLPTTEERREVADFLAARQTDRPVALQDLVWALLASAEFRFNH